MHGCLSTLGLFPLFFLFLACCDRVLSLEKKTRQGVMEICLRETLSPSLSGMSYPSDKRAVQTTTTSSRALHDGWDGIHRSTWARACYYVCFGSWKWKKGSKKALIPLLLNITRTIGAKGKHSTILYAYLGLTSLFSFSFSLLVHSMTWRRGGRHVSS